MDLSSFSAASLDEVTEALRACNAARSFAPTVAADRPYPTVDALVARAGEVSRALPWDEVAQALPIYDEVLTILDEEIS